MRNYSQSFFNGGGAVIDQLDPTRQYVVMAPIDNTALTFYIQCTSADQAAFPSQCPVAGQAFTGFTSLGVPTTTSVFLLLLHAQYDNGYTYNPDYISYVMEALGALNVAGYNMSAALAQGLTRFGVVTDPGNPVHQMDGTVVVP